ncbi:HAMP domain-containing histidine kinase [Ferrimonas sediminicola]|uniref:histidine kinase n=1 Tax=Ferrimonas sediminicola TaxID=2569538 RepID=A0A4U1BFB4_9GAMM|nr:HAMP domain-containing sensor histidine kinase [Ferrimonas sediminicola]TKB48705.1 HAMP domain-containing histidine kinase [Ferrimonas sediminicola]
MPRKLSLKRTYQLYGIGFLVLTLAINSIIPLCMMCTGMFSMHEITMTNAGQAAEQWFRLSGQPFNTDNLTVFRRWESVPGPIQQMSDNRPPTPEQGVFYHHADGPYIDALMAYTNSDNRDYYVWLRYNATHDLVFAPKNMTAILLLIAMTFFVVASLAFYMQNQVITPVHQISRAIKQHDWQNMKPFSFPKQCYAELQSIVDALDNSLKKLKEAQQRELSFLRFASHELRTPIAICQSSFEILSLQQGRLSGPTLHASQATAQMKSITETLLWLTNKECSALEREQVRLGALLEQVVDHQKQAQGYRAAIEVSVDQTRLPLLREPLAIMLNNLIRNAMEHGAQGIVIRQRDELIEITNPTSADNHSGFGLGLMLVKRLAKQLGWQFDTDRQEGRFCAQLRIRP